MDRLSAPSLRWAAAAVALLASCAGEGAPDGGPPEPSRSAPAEVDVDALRALGYAGYADDFVLDGQDVVTAYDPARSQPGYNLFSNRKLCSAQLIDASGRLVHEWQRPKNRHWSNAELLANGDLLVMGSRFVDEEREDYRRYLLRLDWSGAELWRRDLEAHHDAEVDPLGRVVTLTLGDRRVPAVSPEVDLRDNGLAILTADGELLEEHSLYDLLASDPAVFTFQPVAVKVLQGRERVDLLHANSVEVVRANPHAARHPLYTEGFVLVCFRHQDTVAVFDLKSGRVVWAWGQGEISGPHDATLLENGHVLLFDNGLVRGWSRVVELDPVERRIVWQYSAAEPTDFFTVSKGSNQRLANGNTLIANSDHGEAFEVTPAGEIVWRFLNPNAGAGGERATIVRMKRYDTAFVDRFLE